jgi:VanZ family protein
MPRKIGPDKWAHFYVGILMGALLQSVAWYLLPGRPVLDTVLTFVAVVAISYGFEVFSLVTGKGHYEVMDAIAAVIGGIIGMGIGGVFIYVLEHQLGV